MELKDITVSHLLTSSTAYDFVNAVWAEQQLGSDVVIKDAFVKGLPYQPFSSEMREYVISGSTQNLVSLLKRLFP